MSISNNHYGKAISSIDSLNDVKGRPHGGLAILWCKELVGLCKVVEYDDDHFSGIEVYNSDKSMLFINVYHPYDVQEYIDHYSYCLVKIVSFVIDYMSPYLFIGGDFNANC